jgi:hypothetical protein
MKIDYKITTWERFDIEDEYRDALLAFLKENPQAKAMDIYDWYCSIGGDPYPDRVDGTEEFMTPKQNGGFATLEIFDNPNDDAIFSNGN